MSHSEQEEGKKKIKVTVKDRRHTAEGSGGPAGGSGQAPAEEASVPVGRLGGSEAVGTAPPAGVPDPDYLGDLQRLQADFENYRKRMMREVAATGARARASLIEKLLPVLDNFERAIAHGEGGDGVALVFRELNDSLKAEGLEEVPAAGEPFDPNVHEAVMSEEDASVEVPTVKEVYRRGYRLGDQLLRAAMVVVSRPVDEAAAVAETAGE